jgi:hypothetical protein
MAVRPRLVLLAGLALIAAACSNSLDVSTDTINVGSITIRGEPGSAGGTVARPSAVFFEAVSVTVPSSLNPTDSCNVVLYDSTAFTRGSFSGGAPITMSVKGNTASLNVDSTFFIYTPTGTVPYAAGDTAKIAVPGNKGRFPASTIDLRLAEPFTVGSLALPKSGQPLAVTWAGSGDATSAVLISYRYASQQGVGTNEQILCSARDDGSLSIPAAMFSRYFAQGATQASIVVSRYRTTSQHIDSKTLLYAVSAYQVSRALVQ